MSLAGRLFRMKSGRSPVRSPLVMMSLSRWLAAAVALGPLPGCGGDSADRPQDAAAPVLDMPPDVTYPPDGGDTSCGLATVIGCDESKAGNNSEGANTIDLYGCATAPNSGPETYYAFNSAVDRIVTVDLVAADASQDLDLLVLGSDCAATECLDRSLEAAGVPSQVRFAAVADVEYRVVVDGYVDGPSVGAGDYTISVTCAPLECTPSTATIDCATSGLAGNNAQSQSTDSHALYGCGGDTPGREFMYTFVSSVDGEVTITLDIDDPSTDLDLFVLGDTGAGCNVGNCVAASMTRLDEVLRFVATSGTTYYVVVDRGGIPGGRGDYALTVECGALPDGGPTDGGPGDVAVSDGSTD